MKRKTFLQEETNIRKGAKWLPFLWILILTIISSFWTDSSLIHGQSVCNVRLSVATEAASCQANGRISCTLSDTAGASLEQIRFSYVPIDNGSDSIVETTDAHIGHLRPGRYKVKVSALCATGLSYGDAYTIVTDSVEAEVENSYRIPTAGVLYNLFTYSTPYGIVPSLSCSPTGKVQVRIEEGSFPYTIDVWRYSAHDTILVRRVVFDAPQQNGEDPLRYDYRHYYTIDSLESGDYRLLCHDGCGYYTPQLFVSVPTVRHDTQEGHFLLRNSSGIPTSRNIVVFKEVFDLHTIDAHNDEYYFYMNDTTPMFEYRFVNPTKGADKDTTRWYDMPRAVQNMAFLYDTMSVLDNYGEAWFKEIILQTRYKLCPDTIWSLSYTIYPQGRIGGGMYGYNETLEQVSTIFDYCGLHTPGYRYRYHYSYHYYYHTADHTPSNADSTNNKNDNFYTHSGGIPSISDGMSRHSYLTLPVHCKITDITRDSVVYILTDSSMTYTWSFFCLRDTSLRGDTLLLEFYDDMGCPLYTSRVYFNYDTALHYSEPIDRHNYWMIGDANENICSDLPRSIGLFQYSYTIYSYNYQGRNIYSYFGDTLYLVESPRDNFYNLKIHTVGPQQFAMEKERLDNPMVLEYQEYYHENSWRPGFKLSSIGLTPGLYVWVIKHACDRPDDTIRQEVDFLPDPVVSEPPSYVFDRRCSQLEITPVAGQLKLEGADIATFFQIHQEESVTHSANSVTKGNPMYVGIPGTYIISMYALPQNNDGLLQNDLCYIKDTVIEWDGATIQFDHLYSHVCNEGDSIGFVRARGKNGTHPYTYTLYDAPDGEGNIIGQNQTGDFDNIPIHFGQSLSIEMSDACNAHFLTNFSVSDMSKIRKGWAEENMNALSLCEGATCHFFGIALGGATYHWTGPAGFDENSQNAELFLARGSAAAGTYHVEVSGAGCSNLRDSIHLDIISAPWAELLGDTTVCPGTEVPVQAIVHGLAPISYTIACRDLEQTALTPFTNRGDGDRDTLFRTVVHHGTYCYISEIQDARCSYRIPEDTVTLQLSRGDREIRLTCTHDTVCRGTAAMVTAQSDAAAPYCIQWQETHSHEIIRTDTIDSDGKFASFIFDALTNDTTIIAAVEHGRACPYSPSYLYGAIHLCDDTLEISPGESLLVYDSGGPDASYSAYESHILTLRATDSSTTLRLLTDYFACAGPAPGDTADVLYIFDHEGISGTPVLTLRGTHVSIPELISERGLFTLLFQSGQHTAGSGAYQGWQMRVTAPPITHTVSATASVAVHPNGIKDTTLRLTVEEDELPYAWDGILFTQADSVTHLYEGAYGCDSTVTRILSIHREPACPEVVDYDGNRYPSVRINHVCWMQANLRSRHYSDGRAIQGAAPYYSALHPDSTGNERVFGLLYTWHAAVDTSQTPVLTPAGHLQGICPEGWFLPEPEHYAALFAHGNAAIRSPHLWINGTGGHNSTGFTALPAGFYNGLTQRFENLLGDTRFWSTRNDFRFESSLSFRITYYCEEVMTPRSNPSDRYSIRCILEE